MHKCLCLSIFLLMLCHCKKKSHNSSNSDSKDQLTEDVIEGGEHDAKRDNKNVSIPSQKLDKEYIFQANMTYQSPAPEFTSVKSRIVTFKRDGNNILMLESAQGNSIATHKQQGILLAKFSITQDKNDIISFDFNQGMSQLFLMGDLFAEDIYGKEFDAEEKWSALEFNQSWVSAVETHNDFESYDITQKAQLKFRSQTGLLGLYPISVNYSFNLYRPNPNFAAVRSLAKNHVGFFEISPQLREGGGDTILYSTKFHIEDSKPIVYSLSENTPSEYVEAIKHGVFYWNRVLGKEVLKVAPADKNGRVTHLIQWVDWKNASYAYADMSIDPRNGEILNAKVFLTSAFAFDAKVQARVFLTNLEESNPSAFKLNSLAGFDYSKFRTPEQLEKIQAGLGKDLSNLFGKSLKNSGYAGKQSMAIRGFSHIKYCAMHYDARQFSHFLATNEHSKMNDQQILRISQDMITAVVAHEIGHNLGLRHNFAGSLGSTYSPEEFAKEYEQYVDTDKGFTKILTTTVMDYLTFKNSSALGSYIRKGGQALSYDKKAIDVLYNKKALVADSILFCTDTQRGVYVDCDVFDAGASIFSRFKWEENQLLDDLPILIAELFRAAKFPPDGFEPTPLSQIVLSAEQFANMIIWYRYKLIRAISEDAQYLVVRSKYPSISDTNIEKVKEAEKAYLEDSFSGDKLKEYINKFDNSKISNGYDSFVRIFNSFYKKNNLDGKLQEFSDGEVSLIFNKVKELYDRLPYAIAIWDLGLSIYPQTFVGIKAVNEDLPGIIGEKMKYILTKTLPDLFDGKVKLASTNSEKSISVPNYHFPTDVRFAAAFGLVNHQVKDNRLWGVKKNEDINKAVFEIINDQAFSFSQALSIHKENILQHSYKDWSNNENPEMQIRLRNWVLENQAILLTMKNNGPLY
ncbi:MAG: zinc-dependent metalloprotease [Oligoflexales bacterium]